MTKIRKTEDELAVLQEYQKRVVQEKLELDVKISNLYTFKKSDFFETLPIEEADRLERQYMIMVLYSDVLAERINNFK